MNNASQVIKDFKKRILYEMFDAQEFYFDVSDIANTATSSKAAGQMAALANNRELVAKISERIHYQSQAIGTILLESAKLILAAT
jgi:hypothetical protein